MDGSNDDDNVAAAAVSGKCHLPDKSSVFSSEVKAIYLVFHIVAESSLINSLCFQTTIQTLYNMNMSDPCVCDVCDILE